MSLADGHNAVQVFFLATLDCAQADSATGNKVKQVLYVFCRDFLFSENSAQAGGPFHLLHMIPKGMEYGPVLVAVITIHRMVSKPGPFFRAIFPDAGDLLPEVFQAVNFHLLKYPAAQLKFNTGHILFIIGVLPPDTGEN